MTATTGLDAKLDEVARQYDEINAELTRPETVEDLDALKRLGIELARLEPVVEAYRRLQKTRDELAGAHHLRDTESDDDMRQMAQAEIERLVSEEAELLDKLKVLLLPRDPGRRRQRDRRDPCRRRRRRGRALRR